MGGDPNSMTRDVVELLYAHSGENPNSPLSPKQHAIIKHASQNDRLIYTFHLVNLFWLEQCMLLLQRIL